MSTIVIPCEHWHHDPSLQGGGRCRIRLWEGRPATRACVQWCRSVPKEGPAWDAARAWFDRQQQDAAGGVRCLKCDRIRAGLEQPGSGAEIIINHAPRCPVARLARRSGAAAVQQDAQQQVLLTKPCCGQ